MRLLKILFAVTLLLPVACSSDDAATRPIRFWQFWDTALIEPIIAQFEAETGLSVEVEQLTWQSGLEKIQAAIASGTQPDLCELGSTWVPRFSYEGVLADLSVTYEADRDQFIMWESGMWQGKCYALPWVQGSRVLFYNTDLFVQAGLDPQDPPETWDELLIAAMKIDALGPKISGFGLNLGERYILYKKFMAFAWGNGGGILDDDGNVIFDSPENLQALEFYQELAAYSLKEKQEVLDHNFKSGLLGMQISGAWNLKNLALEAPNLNYRVALVPKPSPGRGHHASFAGAEMLVIFQKSQRQADALKLARYLQDYARAKQISAAVQSVYPASKAALEDPAFTSDARVRIFLQQSLTSHSVPAHPGWIEMEDVINRAVEEVLYGRVEAKASLARASDDIRSVLDKFN